MSTKKGKKNVAGWQKLEPTDPRQSNVKESEQPVAEKEQEASSDTAPTETNPAKEEQEEALPTDEKSPASQPVQESTSPKETPKQSTAKRKNSRRKYSVAVPIGGFFVLLAVIGLITVITFGVRATENLIDNSKQKKEFENIILPVLMFDPVPFDDPNEMGDLALLRSSIWASIIENNQKYSISDGNMVAVPQSDVDVACAKLFGPQVTLKHQAFEDYLSMYSYDEATKTYYVPVDATMLYTPQVEEITRNGDVFELTVGYLVPDNQWMQSIKGEESTPTPSKYMIYALKKVDDHYQLVGIKDPPDGAVPGIPQINNQPTVPQTTIEPEQPQTIQPEETEQLQPEETEQPQQQTKPAEDTESAQL